MKYLSFYFFLLFFVISAAAQVETYENAACNAEYSQSLIQQQISESVTVTETDRRIKIYLRAADFLWKLDEPASRKYFTEAFKIANEHFAEKGFTETKLSNGLVMQERDYRFEVIRTIARKDGNWAKRLTEQVLAEYEKNLKDRKNEFDRIREIQDLTEIATENVKTNPNLSLYLFRRLMRYPLDYHWYFSLYQVAADNQQFADNLYKELLEVYANQMPRVLLFLSAYPFGQKRILGIDKFSYGVPLPQNFVPNRNFQRQFIQVFLRRVNAFVNNPNERNRPAEEYRFPETVYIVAALQELEPIAAQNFPDLVSNISQTKAQVNGFLMEQNRKDLEKRQKGDESFALSFDERLKIVEEADAEGKLRDKMIVDLVLAAKTEEHHKKLESWLEKIKDKDARQNSMMYAFFLRSKLAIEENRFNDAARFADKVSELEHRAILYFEIAEKQLGDELESAKVSNLLNKVSDIADAAENSVGKIQVLLGLAQMYEKVNHSLALSKLTEAVRVINQLENPDIFSTAIYRQIHIPNEFSFFAVFSTPGYNFEETFEIIGKNDFELALSNARSLNNKYFRMIATLAIIKNCIEKRKDR